MKRYLIVAAVSVLALFVFLSAVSVLAAPEDPAFSLEEGISLDESESESESVSAAESVSDASSEFPESSSADASSDGFVGWAYLVEPEETATTAQEVDQIPAPYAAISADYTLYGSYADLSIVHGGRAYSFVVPASQLDRLIVEVGSDGTLILINNSGSNVVLQGRVNYESTDAVSFYQLTVPASNLATSVYSYGGYCYLTTYYEYNGSLRSQNQYLSNPFTGSLSTDNLSEEYTSQSAFYGFVMAMLFLTVALLMVLVFRWRVKLHD